jgi:hypothetical protein
MIYRKLFLILIGAGTLSCNSKHGPSINDSIHDSPAIHKSVKITTDSVKAIRRSLKINHSDFLPQAVVSDEVSEVTPLPFSGKRGFVREFVRKYPAIYRLPPIKGLMYFPLAGFIKPGIDCPDGKCVDYTVPPECFDGGKVDTNIFKFKKYRFKLPDIYGLQTYITCDLNFLNYGVDSIYRCSEHYSMLDNGYFILYNPGTQEAKIIALHHPIASHGEFLYDRSFEIDKDFVLHLQDYWSDTAVVATDYSFEIRMLPGGELNIKKISPTKK